MVRRPLRSLTLPDAANQVFTRWLGEIEERLQDPSCDRNRLCRDTLFGLYYPGVADYREVIDDPKVALATRTALLALDPQNVTLEPEYYHEVDVEKYPRVKPLLWL